MHILVITKTSKNGDYADCIFTTTHENHASICANLRGHLKGDLDFLGIKEIPAPIEEALQASGSSIADTYNVIEDALVAVHVSQDPHAGADSERANEWAALFSGYATEDAQWYIDYYLSVIDLESQTFVQYEP